jgi:hypothetical protein
MTRLLNTHCTAGVSCDQITMEYTHGKQCDIHLTLSTRYSRIGTAAEEYALHYPRQRHRDANTYQQLEQSLRETGCARATEHVMQVAH